MIKKLFIANMAALLVLMTWVAACTQEELPALPDPSVQEGLVIDLRTSSIETRATEPGNGNLRENTIETAHVFIFSASGTRSGSETYKKLTFTDGVATLASGDWKNNANMFPDGPDAQYDIYVVANYHGADTDLSAITTVDGLKAAMDTDADIWKPEHGNLGSGDYYSDKLFTMTGNVNFQPSVHDNNYILPVPVTRIAVKIRIYIKLAEDFKAVFTPSGYRSIVRNHATKGLLWADNEERTSSEERGLAGNDAEEQFVEAWQQQQPDAENAAVVVVYTYPNRWGNNALDETFVLLNMPGEYTGNSDGSTGNVEEYKSSNYYKIPIRLGTSADQMVLNRNTIYQTTITIDRLGQTEIDKPVELKPKFEVVDWDEETINISDDDVRYLELLKDVIEMKNISETTEQYFTSSSGVWTEGSGDASSSKVEVVEAYYYNKYGQKTTINKQGYNNPTFPYNINAEIVKEYEGDRFGYIKITSDVPTNHGIRYIKVRVTNEQGVPAEFLVKQYPLEYITAVTGHYSFREDFKYNGQEVRWNISSYRQSYNESGAPQVTIGRGTEIDGWGPWQTTTYYGNFQSKVYDKDRYDAEDIDGENEVIFYYTYSKGWNSNNYTRKMTTEGWNESSTTGLTNPRMYFVRITKTSSHDDDDNDGFPDDGYILAVPALDAQGYTDPSAENNRLVSPAFMLASQLGAVQPTQFFEKTNNSDAFNAKDQCREYVEVDTDGTEYRDWRLPTEAELKIIMQYQYDSGNGTVLDEVLAGQYYWAASGKSVYNDRATNTSSSIPAIRCIRDVKANEPIMQED